MELVNQIYQTLTKKRYNREEPYLNKKLKEQLSLFIDKNQPIKLVGFWGIGPKTKANWADEKTCEFLSKLNNEIREVYLPGIEFTFIFATTHGIHNGISKKAIISYTKGVEKLFKKYQFKFIYLDSLWKKYKITFKKINELHQNQPKGWWSKIKNHKLIDNNAKKRNLRLNFCEGAQKYFIFRDLEKEMLEKEFPKSIFHAFSDSRLRSVLPNMPTLYFYSRKGWSDTPWFITKNPKK